MNRTLIYISFFLLLVSCRKENGSESPASPLEITPSVTPVTKALVDGSNITGQQIGVQITNEAGTAIYQTGCENLALTYSSSWSLATTVNLTSAHAKIYAYAPYSATAGDFTGIGEASVRKMDIDARQLMSSQTDYLWAAQSTTTSNGSTSITGSNTTVALTMSHSLAQVAFVIYKEFYPAAGNISQIEIKDYSNSSFIVNKTGTNDLRMNIADGSISGGQASPFLMVSNVGSAISLLSDPGNDQATLDGLKNGYFLMVPVTIPDQTKLRFIFTIDGDTYSVPTGGTGSLNWQKGNQYIYTLKLSGTALSLSGVSVAPWGTNVTSGKEIGGQDVVPSTANCYIVAPGNYSRIPVGIKGNGEAENVAGTGLSVNHTAASVAVLWQTSDNLVTVSDFNSASQMVTVTANSSPSTGGNAVIAAYSGANGTGNILWSWHIWVTNYNPDAGTTYNFNTSNPLTFMDRNLGATNNIIGNVGTYGLLYQWGRKDPFPNASTNTATTEPTLSGTITTINKATVSISNNLANSILNPGTFYCYDVEPYSWYSNSGIYNLELWGSPSTFTVNAKTIFDPCPLGWRVPPFRNSVSPWSSFAVTSSTYGFNGATTGYWPSTGLRAADNGNLINTGSVGGYWSASAAVNNGYNLMFNTSIYPEDRTRYGGGRSIRCVKEF